MVCFHVCFGSVETEEVREGEGYMHAISDVTSIIASSFCSITGLELSRLTNALPGVS